MTFSASENYSFRPDINALRALAVMSVIFYHFDMLGASSGYIGVDVFFVISGFLIGGQVSTQIAAGQFRLSAFMVSRIRRILPALVVVCIAVYLWGWLYMLPGDYRLLVRNVLSVVSFVSNISFASQQGYFDLGAQYKPLLHTWSLSVEAQFYLLLPFFLMVAFRLPTRLRLLATAALTATSLATAIVMGSRSPDTVFFAFTARAWEFLAGCLVAWFTQGTPGRLAILGVARKGLVTVAWVALIASCFLLPKGVVWPGLWTLVPVLLVASIIVLGSGQAAGPLVCNRVVQHVGTISYSLYLWHWPLIVCWKLMNSEPVTTSGITLWVLLAATWGLALLSWRFVESPFRSNRVFWNARKLYGAYAVTFTAFTATGVAIWTHDGVPSRLPTYLNGAITAAHFEPPLNKRCWDLPRALPNSSWACDFGVPSDKPGIAIWGDSHSLQFLEVLRGALDKSPVSGYLFHRPGCEPAFPDQPRGDICDAHNEEVLQRIDNTPSIKTVIIAIRQNELIRVDRAWKAAERLLEKDYKVIFLGPLPEAKRAVAQEWATTQLFGRTPVMEMTLARDVTTRVQSFNERLIHWRTTASSMKTRYPGKLVTLDLTDTFCDASQCWFVRDGVGLFWDADHLTLAGAGLVLPALLKAMESP
jgi:peptidoglycan/LPS O-acetylase OafA/YrhL